MTYLVCVKNDGHSESLQLKKIYRALPDPPAGRHGYVRVVDETGDDYLYPRRYFIPVALPRDLSATVRRILA